METTGGWEKYRGNPVLGGEYGTCFDIAVLQEDNGSYRMYFSWRPKKSVALTESRDGVHWSEPLIVLVPEPRTGWEDDINRPVVLKRNGLYHMWYTGQAGGKSWIGYATSTDGCSWERMSSQPVVSAENEWENVAVMCPHVLWDEETECYRMWYSGGEQFEPNAIGHAVSKDGLHWTKDADNPIFEGDRSQEWEQERATACQVVKEDEWYIMFYIGFEDVHHAQIGIARSRDGLHDWQRHSANPIIRPGKNSWDHDACYKPFALYDGNQWRLWYNGRHGRVEQIGLAFHPDRDLGFDTATPS